MISPPGSEHPDGAPRRWWKHSGVSVAVLCGLMLAFYHGLWLPDRVLIKRDAFAFFLPLKQHMIERLTAGELPQWFPYEGLGRPFIGTTHTGVFHPFTALYFMFSVPDAYRASTLLSCLIGALGAFALGRMLKISNPGALLAGIVFALSGYVVSLTDNLVYLHSACLLPLFCIGLEKALRGPRAWVIAPAAIWASVFLIGDVQTGYYYGLIALLWMGTRMPDSYREAGLKLALMAGLAILLAGIQLGPAWATFADSERAQPDRFRKQTLTWSTHPLRLLTVAASPVGEQLDPVTVGRVFFGHPTGGVWVESLYLGVPVIGLALLGSRHRPDLRVLPIIGVVGLLLALGKWGGLYGMLYEVVPLWSAFRYPEKFMGVVSFAAAMLAGSGLDALRVGKGGARLWLAAAVLCAVAGLGLATDTAGEWAAANADVPAAMAHAMTASAGLAFFYSALATLGVWLLIAWAQRGSLRSPVLLLALTALITLDLSRATLGAYHTGPADAATFTPPLAQALASTAGPLAPGRFRIISLREKKNVVPKSLYFSLGHYGATSIEHRQALDVEENAVFHLETPQYYLPGYSSALPTIMDANSPAVAARYNVSFYVGPRSRTKDPQFAAGLIAQLPPYGLALFRNPAPAKPRVYLSERPEPTASPVEPAAMVLRPDFLSGAVDVIETHGEPLPGPAQDGTARIARYEPEDVRVHVETPQSAVLVLLDAYDKGWTATLENGMDLPILRANALVRAVIVPAGNHVVTFSYQTPLLKAGAWASMAGVLLCLGLIVGQARRRSADRPPN
jgi:hypothetical protein